MGHNEALFVRHAVDPLRERHSDVSCNLGFDLEFD